MTEDRHVRPFAEFLQSHARGALHDALSEGLSELIEAEDTFAAQVVDQLEEDLLAPVLYGTPRGQ